MLHTDGFDTTADVVVLGFGNAGAVTAVTAHDAGASVVIVDKQPQDDHRPNSRYAAGFLMVPTDIDAAAQYLQSLYRLNGEASTIDPEQITTWAEQTAANPDWIEQHGGLLARLDIHGEHTTVAGHEAITVYKVQPTRQPDGYAGCPLYGLLRSLVADRGIEVRYGTKATELLTDPTGAVIGVRVEHHGTSTTIGADRGVVLATGGYEGNEQLKTQFLPVSPVHFYGSQRNTGDGVILAQQVGAELWHMNLWPGSLVAQFPGEGYRGGTSVDLWGSGRFGPDPDRRPPGAVFVDGSARRYLAEPGRQHAANLHLTAMDADRLTHPRIPTWWIFDDRRFAAAPLVPAYSGPTGPVQDYSWSADNRAELDKGWIVGGGTLPELAQACGLDPAALQATVEQYNSQCAAGVDADFGRDPRTLTPLEGPGYYAVPLWPGGSHTVGGPRRDGSARVCRAGGGTIGNLFSAGELGSMYGLLYPAGGASLAECLAFGRVAGASAAQNRIHR